MSKDTKALCVCQECSINRTRVKDEQTLPKQVGGTHYSKLGIQPWTYFTANASHDEIRGACIQNILKYIIRKKDNTQEDLLKAKWYLEQLILVETKPVKINFPENADI